MKIAVVGTGYVGTVTGACLAYVGHSVTCIDTDRKKIAALQADQPACYEPHLAELLALAKQRGGIDFTTEMGAVAACQMSSAHAAAARMSKEPRIAVRTQASTGGKGEEGVLAVWSLIAVRHSSALSRYRK